MSGMGITGFGAYLPARRLCRRSTVEAIGWLAPQLRSIAEGSRSLAAWDEDSLTMAVEACRNAMPVDSTDPNPGSLTFASTTPVFLDRLNAGVIAAALDLDETLEASDLIGTRRAGTTALLQAFDRVVGRPRPAMVVAADKRHARAGSAAELSYGDAAACFVIGDGHVLARLLGRCSLTVDFVDRHRSPAARFEHLWEDRWIREEGYCRWVPRAVDGALRDAGLDSDAIDHWVLPGAPAGSAARVLGDRGVPRGRLADDLGGDCGDTGSAGALLALAAVLERARPGERILVTDFGHGCDAFIIETTAGLAAHRPRRSLAVQRAAGVPERNYLRHLVARGLVDWERGPRAERDTRTSLSVLHRNRRMLLGMVGGRDVRTGEVQFPPGVMALDERGTVIGTLEPWRLADRRAQVVSWSADRMSVSPDPPNYYGMVDFEGGGRLMMDFVDLLGREVVVGMPMRMVFRVKEVDLPRDYTRYFWKATPDIAEA